MKYYLGFIFLLVTSPLVFSQQFEIKDSKIEVTSVSQPLLVVDGRVMPKLVPSNADSTKMVSPLSNLDPNEIERMEVLKNLNAVLVYGEAGKNGVVRITLKNPEKN